MPKPVDEIPENELGIARDRASEARMVCEDSASYIRKLAVDLETTADSQYIPINLSSDLMNQSQEVHDIADRLEQQSEIEKSRLEAIQERLEKQ